MPINRENVPEEFADALLGEADCFVSLPEVKELILPIGAVAGSMPDAEFTYLKAAMLGDDYESIPMVMTPLPVADVGPSCPCSCFACALQGDCKNCTLGCSGSKLKAKPSAPAPIIHVMDADEKQELGRVALRNARKYKTLLPEQLSALEQYVEGKSSNEMQKFAGSLRVRRIVPPSREDSRFKVEFDQV